MRALSDFVMTLLIYASLIIVIGCVRPPDSRNLEAFVAVTGNYGIEESLRSPTPAPAPESDKCDICRGTGKADGRAVCPACNGTGKKTKAKVTSTGQTIIVHPPAANCVTGTCSTQRIVR